jgi:uncharacterized membrane protein YkoI
MLVASLTRALAGLGLGLWLGLGACAAEAQPGNRGERQQDLRTQEAEEEPRISRRQASDLVRDRYPGRVLNVTLERGVWRVRVDNEGTVFTVLVDGESGRIVPQENAR